MNQYLTKTKLLDFDNESIVRLVADRKWDELPPKERIMKIYDFVRNEIAFGYNASDDVSASVVLNDGYGQCNTKATLFMALLRAVNVPCRFHGFAIHKKLQKGLINGVAYRLAPNEILHSWVEVNYLDRWYNLEGLILDEGYLKGLKLKIGNKSGLFCGFGVDVKDFEKLQIEWNECDTYIQKEGIVRDYGVYDNPDQFYDKVGTNLGLIKKIIYLVWVRRVMNSNVKGIRT